MCVLCGGVVEMALIPFLPKWAKIGLLCLVLLAMGGSNHTAEECGGCCPNHQHEARIR